MPGWPCAPAAPRFDVVSLIPGSGVELSQAIGDKGTAARRKLEKSVERRDRDVATLPASPPTPTPPTAADEPKQQEKHDGPYEGVEDESNDAGAKMDAEPWQQPVAYKCADQADNQISDQTETAALHDSTGEPSCDNPHD